MCSRHSISGRLRTYSWVQPGSVKFISFKQVLLYTFKIWGVQLETQTDGQTDNPKHYNASKSTLLSISEAWKFRNLMYCIMPPVGVRHENLELWCRAYCSCHERLKFRNHTFNNCILDIRHLWMITSSQNFILHYRTLFFWNMHQI